MNGFDIILVIESAIFGAIVGSFLNVVALRYTTKEDIVASRSHCSHCNKTLRWWELVPVVSFIALRGRCARCGKKISYRYVVVEIVTAIVTFAIVGLTQSGGYGLLEGIGLLMSAYILIVLALIDLKTMLLPDVFVGMLALVVIITRYIAPISFMQSLLGVAVGSGFLLAIWIITRGKGIGFGDVKLMIPLGILMGPWGAVGVLFLSFISGGVFGVILLGLKKADAKTAVPFGPFLVGSALLLLTRPDFINTVYKIVSGY